MPYPTRRGGRAPRPRASPRANPLRAVRHAGCRPPSGRRNGRPAECPILDIRPVPPFPAAHPARRSDAVRHGKEALRMATNDAEQQRAPETADQFLAEQEQQDREILELKPLVEEPRTPPDPPPDGQPAAPPPAEP